MLRLSAWSNAWIEYRWACRGGRPSIRLKPATPDRHVHGFGSYEPVSWPLRRFYAVYGDEGRFVFQAGREHWDLTDGPIEVRFHGIGGGTKSEVSLRRGPDLLHNARLSHPGRGIWPRIDPTYDFIDAETDHFFLMLRNKLHDDEWRQRIVDMARKAER